MSLQTRLVALAQALGADVKQIKTDLASHTHAGSGGTGTNVWTEQILTGAINVANQTPVDILTGFTPAGSTRYLIEAVLSVNSSAATNGVQAQLGGPTAGIIASAVKIVSAASATADLISHLALNQVQPATANLTTANLIQILAIVETGGTPGAGNIRPRVQSETAAVSTVRAGSTMRWRTL